MRALAARAGGDGVAFSAAPVKGFERWLAKAREYADERGLRAWRDRVLAPLHVIDGLRCSFKVESIARNVEIGAALEAECELVRTKNGHTRDNVGYADRKFNLVTPAYDGCGGARLLCEVQVLMRRYIEIKEIGHLVYEIARGD